MENSTYIKPYFYIEEERIIYPASTWKRIGARFLDILLINIFIAIIFAIIYSNIGKYAIPEDTTNLTYENYQDYVPPLYSLPFMIVVAFGLFLLIIFNLVIPFFNKKNPGQTFGKFLFGITPIFFSKNSKRNIIARELPITIIISMPLIILLVMGGNPNFYYSQAIKFLEHGGTIFKRNEFEMTTETGFYNFVSKYMTNPEIMPKGIVLNQITVIFIYLKQIFTGIYWIFLIALLISIAFNHQKMGLIDKLVNTSVVDLKTIIDRSLIEGDPHFSKDDSLESKEAPFKEGPPVKFNK